MSNIFFSYARNDQDAVDTLVQHLDSLSHTVWFDKELSGGQPWWEHVLAEIQRCDTFVFGMSPGSLDSYACKLEYTYAYDLGKTIVPILLADGVSVGLLPEALSKIQFVDYRLQDSQAVISLVRALQNLPPSQPLPDPLPEPPEVPLSYLGALKAQIETRNTLTFEEQTGLVVTLKGQLREPEQAEDVRGLLRSLRQRNDLLANVATEIDEALAGVPEAGPEPPIQEVPPAGQQLAERPPERDKESWSAVVTAKGWAERTLEVHLSRDSHVIEYIHKVPNVTNWATIKVDGETAAEGGLLSTNQTFDFQVKDGDAEYSAHIDASLGGMLGRLSKLRLTIAGRELYREG